MKPILSNGKIVGYWNPELKVFSKKVDNKKHLMRKYDAYAISKAIFDKLLEKQALIEINDNEGNTYTLSAVEARSHGVSDKIGDYEMQFFIPRSAFRKTHI